MLDVVRHWRGTNPLGIAHENLVRVANAVLAKRLSGEDPRNDITRRQRKLLVAIEVLRGDVEDAVTSYESGRMSVESALLCVNESDAAITAITAIIACD